MCCCNDDNIPDIKFVDENGNAVDSGEYTIVGVGLSHWTFASDDITFIVRDKDDASS